MMSQAVKPFDWCELVPHFVHPVKVAVIEAFQWIDQPMASSELRQVLDEGLSYVSYHVRGLAEVGALIEVNRESVRGAIKTTYVLADRPDSC
jgi:hypothetical protein